MADERESKNTLDKAMEKFRAYIHKAIQVVLILMIVSTNSELFATAQAPDILIMDNDNKRLCTNPLESLFSKNPSLKEKFDDIFSRRNGIVSTACWRGYIAKFKVVDSSLYIVDITIKTSDSETNRIKTISIFSELLEADRPVSCDFYSGMLVIPQGDMVKYVHGDYLSEYEKYILMKITGGKIEAKGEYSLQDYREKKDKAFEAFYRSRKYAECWDKIKRGFAENIGEESRKSIMKEIDSFYMYDFYDF